MKPAYLYVLLALVLFITNCSSSSNTLEQPQRVLNVERPIPYSLEHPDYFQKAIDKGTRTKTGNPGPHYFTNSYKYVLDAELVPADTMLYGEASISYTNNSSDTLYYLVFELAQNLHKAGVPRNEFVEITGGVHISRISVNGTESKEMTRQRPTYQEIGTNLVVYPDERILPNEKINVEIDWNFKVPQAGASGRMGYSQDNVFFIAYWFPHISTYDDLDGWFGDNFTGNAEFYYDFGNYEVNITAPEQWLVMSTGQLKNPDEVLSSALLDRYTVAQHSDTVVNIASSADFGQLTQVSEDGTLTWKFEANQVRDIAFSATKESNWDAKRTPIGDLDNDGNTDYTLINAFWRDLAPLWEKSAEYTAHSISYLSDYTGISYPWPHMTSVEGADIIGGGMEFPMMTVIGSYNNPNPNVSQARKERALYDVTAHEIAHMWIPMIVSSNERRHAWMDEGATTFHEAQARWDYLPDTFSRLAEFNSYLPIAGNSLEGEIMRWSDYHYPGPAYGVASYPKPASVLIALQGVLGEDVFKEAWETFMSRWAYKHPTPYDMFNTFEDVSGQDLDWFWRSWYFETWTLDQAVDKVVQNGKEAAITIRDFGKVVMPVDLTISFENGSQTEVRIGVDDWMMGKRITSTRVDAPSPITKVEIDARHYFPDADRANNIWERTE